MNSLHSFYRTISVAMMCYAVSIIAIHANEAANQPPNIVYILADDMGYGDVSALNPESKIKTPNLDKMASEGMTFTDAHTASSVCTPTRYGLLTGRYCWRTRLKKEVLWNYDNSLMEPERLNVASFLKQNGYTTAMVGKWHLGIDWPSKSNPAKSTSAENAIDFTKPFRNGPLSMGFDTFFGINASLDMPPYVFLEGDKPVTVPTLAVPKGEYGRPGLADPNSKPEDFNPEFTKRAVSFIEAQDPKRPFFLYMPLASPHTPIAPSKPFQGKSQLSGKLGKYADFCMEVDDTVGQIMAALEKKGLSENTILIFTADNGCAPYIGVEEFEKAGHRASWIYKGYKASIYEGGHRVPFFVKWPKTVKPGSKQDQTICLNDLLATCADLLGKTLPENAGEDSLSFLAALHEKPIDTSRREAIVHHDYGGKFAIRKGKWKFCEEVNGGFGSGIPSKASKSERMNHLYDLEADPGEKHNVASEHPEIVKELVDLLEKYKTDGRSVQP